MTTTTTDGYWTLDESDQPVWVATTTTTTTTTDHDAEAMRLGAGLDPATTLAIWTRTPEALRHHLRAASIDSAPYEGEAIHAALAMVASGVRQSVEAIIERAASTTARDAIRTAAIASVSLDVVLDTAGDVAERWSAYDDGAGIYRGVSRVPMPTDCLRADLPNPGTVADASMATLAEPYRRALAACLAVNVAAESQRRALMAEQTAYMAQAERDAKQAKRDSRSRRAALIGKARKDTEQARRDTRKLEATVYRLRQSEVCEALGLKVTGRNQTATTQALTMAEDAYWTARDGIVSDALKAHSDALSENAERQREAYRLGGGHTVAHAARENVPAHAEPLGYIAPRTSGDRPRRAGTFDAVSSYGKPINGSALAVLAHADSRTTSDLPSSARHGERAVDSALTSTCGGAPTIG